MSLMRIMRPLATKLMSRMSCSEWKAPVTRSEIRLVAGLDDAGRADLVLRVQRGQQRRAVDTEAASCSHRELDEDHLVLGADDVDLRDVGHVEQLGADLLDMVTQLALLKPSAVNP